MRGPRRPIVRGQRAAFAAAAAAAPDGGGRDLHVARLTGKNRRVSVVVSQLR